MNIQKLIISILETATQNKEEKIKRMSQQIAQQMNQLDQLEKDKKINNEKALFDTFFKVIEQISKEVAEAKQKYTSIDREKLRQQKCRKMAKQIKIFKEECFHLKDKLQKSKKQLQKISIQNSLLEDEQELLVKICQRKQQQKTRMKTETQANFWWKDKQKSNKSYIDTNKTAFSFDLAVHVRSSSKKQGKRIISTSQDASRRKLKSSYEISRNISYQKYRKSKQLTCFNKSTQIE